jgi:4'-phosphopantetheinyl transferase
MKLHRYRRWMLQASQVEPGVQSLSLAAGIIDFWWQDLAELARSGRDVVGNLSPDERLRAERSSGGVTGSRFALGRGYLREVLGAYCNVHPSRIKFEYGPSGKPALAGISGADRVTFSTSCAGRLIVIAITIGDELGIDIEPLMRHTDIAPIADAVFSQNELDLFDVMPQRKRETAMVRGWTAKEAILKADGRGLVADLTTIDVLNNPGKSTGCSTLRAAWRVLDVSVPVSGYVASLAIPARVDAPGRKLFREPQSLNWR